MTVSEYAKKHNITRQAVLDKIKRGTLKAIKVPSDCRYGWKYKIIEEGENET